jgi:hypothetical protein
VSVSKEVTVTAPTTPMRGFLVRRGSGELVELPPNLVGPDSVGPDMQEKAPGEPVRYLSARDLYDRHLLAEENVYVYVNTRAQADAEALLKAVRPAIRKRLGLT